MYIPLRPSKMISSVLITALLIASAWASEDRDFSYDDPSGWPGVCVSGNDNRQSPINIVAGDVRSNSELVDLDLSGWSSLYDGLFNNTGITTQFTPNVGGATTRNHLGTYELRNVHWHWGRRTGQGSLTKLQLNWRYISFT